MDRLWLLAAIVTGICLVILAFLVARQKQYQHEEEAFQSSDVCSERVRAAVGAVSQEWSDAVTRLYSEAVAKDAANKALLRESVTRGELTSSVSRVMDAVADVEERLGIEQTYIKERVGQCARAEDMRAAYIPRAEVKDALQPYALAGDVENKLSSALSSVAQTYATRDHVSSQFATLEKLAELDKAVAAVQQQRADAGRRLSDAEALLRGAVTRDEVAGTYATRADVGPLFDKAAEWGRAARTANTMARELQLSTAVLTAELGSTALDMQRDTSMLRQKVGELVADITRYMPADAARSEWRATYAPLVAVENMAKTAVVLEERVNKAESAALAVEKRQREAEGRLCLDGPNGEPGQQVCITAAHLAELRRVVEDYARVTGRENQLRDQLAAEDTRAKQLLVAAERRRAETEDTVKSRDLMLAEKQRQLEAAAATQREAYERRLAAEAAEAGARERQIRSEQEAARARIAVAQETIASTTATIASTQRSYDLNEAEDKELEDRINLEKQSLLQNISSKNMLLNESNNALNMLQQNVNKLDAWKFS